MAIVTRENLNEEQNEVLEKLDKQYGEDVVDALMSYSMSFEEVQEQLEGGAYHGTFDSKLDFACQLVDDLGILSGSNEIAERYFDYDAFARDLFMTDYWCVQTNGSVYVFSNNY
jgi:antirestriction protein